MKESKKKAQCKIVYHILKEYPQTTKMIQVNTGIPRENITRHISELERRKKVTVVERKKCSITRHLAKYYSSERKYFKPVQQSELFPPQNKNKAGVLR